MSGQSKSLGRRNVRAAIEGLRQEVSHLIKAVQKQGGVIRKEQRQKAQALLTQLRALPAHMKEPDLVRSLEQLLGGAGGGS